MNIPRIKFLSTALPALLLAACGGGSGSAPAPAPLPSVETGTIAITLTDNPDFRYDEVNVTIASIELLGPAGPTMILENEIIVNLLDLQTVADLIAVGDVPAGVYTKIRLHITDLELVEMDDNGVVVETLHPDLPANGKIDLNPRGQFSVFANALTHIELDFDAEKSIHIVTTGNGKVKFRPVIFVRLNNFSHIGRLLRVHGTVTRVDDTNERFLLCPRRIVANLHSDAAIQHPAFRRCLVVNSLADTGLFDDQGDPVGFEEVTTGVELTAIGFPGPFSENDNGDEFDLQRIALDAVTIEIGPRGAFAHLRGVTTSGVDPVTEQFAFELAPNQGFTSGSEIQVQLQEGTRIFSPSGVELSASDVIPDLRGLANGVLMLSSTSPDILKSTIIILRNVVDEITRLSGEIVSIDADAGRLILATDGGDLCVDTTPATKIFLISMNEDGMMQQSELVGIEELETGMDADSYGPMSIGGCQDAKVIIAFEDAEI